MTKIDNSFMERLGEVLYDDKKAINYKMASVMLGVHVNIAKQMLYQFYTTDRKEKKKIHAIYLLSGMATFKALHDLWPLPPGRETEETRKRKPESESFLLMLCKDKELEKYKAKFSQIYSIHIHTLCPFPVENYDVLEGLAKEPLVDSEGRTPLDFGPITCSESANLLEGVPVPVLPVVKAPEPEVKKSVAGSGTAGKEKTSGDSKGSKMAKEDVPVVEEKKGVGAGQKPAEKKNGGGGGANRLKNMFASAAAKPSKPKVEEKKKPEPQPKAKEVTSSVGSSSSKAKALGSKSEAKNKDTRKRKRIRDVLSSSEDEDEEKKVESDESDCLPESPLPQRKRIQIDSDSDDDFKEAPELKKARTPAPEPSKLVAPGKRRVVKMVAKTTMSEDGFLVVEKEQRMVSEEEDGGEEDVKEVASAAPAETKKVAEPKPSSKPVGLAKPSSGKTKQQSLMSIFQKK